MHSDAVALSLTYHYEVNADCTVTASQSQFKSLPDFLCESFKPMLAQTRNPSSIDDDYHMFPLVRLLCFLVSNAGNGRRDINGHLDQDFLFRWADSCLG